MHHPLHRAPATPSPPDLLRPDIACPHCGSRPALRLSLDAVLALAHLADDLRAATYQCQRRTCAHRYDILVEHCRRAS